MSKTHIKVDEDVKESWKGKQMEAEADGERGRRARGAGRLPNPYTHIRSNQHAHTHAGTHTHTPVGLLALQGAAPLRLLRGIGMLVRAGESARLFSQPAAAPIERPRRS